VIQEHAASDLPTLTVAINAQVNPANPGGAESAIQGLLAHLAAERQGGGHGTRWRKDRRVRDDPHESIQHQV